MSSKTQPTVLVVDDSETDLEIISIVCNALGCSVDLASDGFEALKLYEERRHDLVLTDYVMEPMNGIYVVSRIKELNPDVPCLIVTGFPNSALRRFYEEGGVDDLIMKPIQAASLKEKLRLVLNCSEGATAQVSGIALSNRMDDCPPLSGDDVHLGPIREKVAQHVSSSKPLLIVGAQGTMKRLIAEFIHENGPNAARTCTEVSCSCLTESSFHYDLIGKDGQWRSLLRQTEGGTLILRKTLSLPLKLQKVLADHFDEISQKMKVIALTARDPDEALEKGEMDDSLYFKLTTEQIELAPRTSKFSTNPARQNPEG